MLSLMPFIPKLSRNAFKTHVVVVGVEAVVDLPTRPPAYDPMRAAIAGAGRGNGVLVLKAAWLRRQQVLAITKHDAVFLKRKWPAGFDPPQCHDRLLRQLRDTDAIARRLPANSRGLRPCFAAGFISCAARVFPRRIIRPAIRLSCRARPNRGIFRCRTVLAVTATAQSQAKRHHASIEPRALHETFPRVEPKLTTLKDVRVSLMTPGINDRSAYVGRSDGFRGLSGPVAALSREFGNKSCRPKN